MPEEILTLSGDENTYTCLLPILSMKTKLTLTIDESLLPQAKRYARERGVSLSSLVESVLRDLTESDPPTHFTAQWRGRMALAQRDDERFRALVEKYG